MSERGSVCSEFIYCTDCYNNVKELFEKMNTGKYFNILPIRGYSSLDNPKKIIEHQILAGNIGGLHIGEEIMSFQEEYVPEIEKVICHPMRFCVLAEVGERIFHIKPAIE
jgi:hypothetical protein